MRKPGEERRGGTYGLCFKKINHAKTRSCAVAERDAFDFRVRFARLRICLFKFFMIRSHVVSCRNVPSEL